MRIDRDMAALCSLEGNLIFLRFYGWKSPTLSLGNNQKTIEGINYSYLKKKGIDLIYRPSGGKAVLHDNEITYCIVSSNDTDLFPKDILGIYKKINTALLRGIKHIGLKGVLYNKERERNRSSNCFSSFAAHELLVNGKKIAGSAQRRFRKVFFQHGSVLTRIDKKKWINIFTPQHKNSHLPVEKMTSIYDEGIREISNHEIVDKLIQGFREALDLSFEKVNRKDNIYVQLGM